MVVVVAPIGNSDHSSLLAVISMAQTVPNLCVSRKVFLKHEVNWNTVCGAIQDLPRHNIWLSDNRVEVLNKHLPQLVGHYEPTKVIRVHTKDKPWFDDQCRYAFGLKGRRLIFGRPMITLGLTGKSLSIVKWELMKPTWWPSISLLTETGMFLWMFIPLISGSPLLIKSAVFGLSSSSPPLVSKGGGLLCESVGKADLQLDHFDSKHSWEAVDLPLTYHPPPSLTTFAFRSSEGRWLLLDLDTYGGTDQNWEYFLFFLRKLLMLWPPILV